VNEYQLNYPAVILMVGGIIIVMMLIKSGLERTSVPALVGFLGLGVLLRLIEGQWGFLTPGCQEIMGFMAKVGLITLLFRVGLESNVEGLLSQFSRASVVWVGDILVSGFAGFLAAFYLLDLTWITSLIVATAFTATSVGITVAIWEETGDLQSPNGELLIDVAEMDDISAVILMAMLFSVLPELKGGGHPSLITLVPRTLGIFLIKLLSLGALCYLFSRYAVHPVVNFFKQIEAPPDPMLVVVAIGFIIAASSEMLGFSLAIGAFFAGLVFSRDSETVKMESSFLPLYELFSPFFFIGIGMAIEPASISESFTVGTVLLIMAVLGKVIADGIPMTLIGGMSSGILVGCSMVPRAEIAMVIMHRGLRLGDWAVPSKVFGAMVMVSTVTCMFSPLVVRSLLRRWPQGREST
jgi:Kef-type K+ transport system membrane component KefB